ncbi:hypothetical protein DFQ29_009771 [Apophysomyces sp. BC1021]|nr:hypothetical protein DFQ29_009771 [Apophysomyces sp. BC1021]
MLQLSFVGSFANFSLNFWSPFSQILISFIGTRWGLAIATVLCTTGLELASLSTKIWQLYLTQGFLYGAGASIIFYAAMSSVSQWFSKKKGLALGIISSGSCIGGVIIPFIMTVLNNRLGVGW